MNRILQLNDTKNIIKDYIDHISRSVNLAIKTISNDKTKKSKKIQNGGIPPVLFYGAVLAFIVLTVFLVMTNLLQLKKQLEK